MVPDAFTSPPSIKVPPEIAVELSAAYSKSFRTTVVPEATIVLEFKPDTKDGWYGSDTFAAAVVTMCGILSSSFLRKAK
jgi:hypothetical protein